MMENLWGITTVKEKKVVFFPYVMLTVLQAILVDYYPVAIYVFLGVREDWG